MQDHENNQFVHVIYQHVGALGLLNIYSQTGVV